MQVAGVDGCRGGWIVSLYDAGQKTLGYSVMPSFREVLSYCDQAEYIAVDIPIGLAKGKPRVADTAAKRILKKRASCMFPAPDRRLLQCDMYETANAESRRLSGKGLSKQTYNILSKIREVDEVITPLLQSRVFEIHPEVSFWALARSPLIRSKHTAEGYARRAQLLAEALQLSLPHRDEVRQLAPGAAPDDLLDSLAGVWTALRAAHGSALRIPKPTQIDARGLRMEIIF